MLFDVLGVSRSLRLVGPVMLVAVPHSFGRVQLHDSFVESRLANVGVVKNKDGLAIDALASDHPVAKVLDLDVIRRRAACLLRTFVSHSDF